MNPSPGFFVVLEGPEGAGKSTLAAALAGRLRQAGAEPVLVREPGGTPAAEALRAELLSHDRRWTPETELLYMVTARADLVARVIVPALAAGRVVVSDRFDLSTRAYQGAGRGIEADRIDWINAAATGGLAPDLTLVLDVPFEVGRRRQEASGKVQDRLDLESTAFHERVAAFYRAARGPGVHHLDATVPPGQLEDAAWRVIESVGARVLRAR